MMAEEQKGRGNGNGAGSGIRWVNVQLTQEEYDRIVKAKEKTGLAWRQWLMFVVERIENLPE